MTSHIPKTEETLAQIELSGALSDSDWVLIDRELHKALLKIGASVSTRSKSRNGRPSHNGIVR